MAYVPGPQAATHEVAPNEGYVPAPHGRHCAAAVAPCAVEYVPGGQSMHQEYLSAFRISAAQSPIQESL